MRPRLVLLLSGSIQLALASVPDTMGDALQYRLWTRTMAREGLAEAYWPRPTTAALTSYAPPPVDYPPLLPYVLWMVGHGLAQISPQALASDRLLDFLIRLPLCAANLLLALLVYGEARRVAGASTAFLPGLVALNPALIFDTAYWGQADALCAVLVVAAAVALVRGRPEWSLAAVTAAVLVKPLAWPFAPLLLLETVKRFGPRRAARAGAGAVVLIVVALLPFVALGRLVDAVRAFAGHLDAMPYLSVNAHNLWWLVGRGLPWTEASTPALGPLSWRALSLVLFGVFYVLTLLWLWRSSEPHSLYVAAASAALGFFNLATHMHENHLFYAVPLLALAGLRAKRVQLVLVVVTATFLVNMLAHDPFLTHLARAHAPGPHLLRPGQPRIPIGLADFLVQQGYPYLLEQVRGETSLAGLLLTLVNAQVNVAVFVAWLLLVYSGSSLDPVLEDEGPWPRPRQLGLLLLAFAIGSGVAFLLHTLPAPPG